MKLEATEKRDDGQGGEMTICTTIKGKSLLLTMPEHRNHYGIMQARRRSYYNAEDVRKSLAYDGWMSMQGVADSEALSLACMKLLAIRRRAVTRRCAPITPPAITAMRRGLLISDRNVRIISFMPVTG